MTTPRIFISYKRGVSPDEPVALEAFNQLRKHFHVFIDQTMMVGTLWAEQIEKEIRQADFLISFLSEHSVASEMVLGEIETAHRLCREHKRPVILPVRLAYREPFQYPLSAYLNSINWALWRDENDTARLIEELRHAIAGGQLDSSGDADSQPTFLQPSLPVPSPSAQPRSLDMPEGTIDANSAFYIERVTDQIALRAINRQGVGTTIAIKGPRQMGKSSLLIRTIEAAMGLNKRVAFLDFQLFDKAALSSPDIFFPQFCVDLSDALEIENKVEEHWNLPLSNIKRCERYMSRYILKELGSPLLLAMDETDKILDTPFRTDFFGMLRAWHNNRANPTMPIWKCLDLALVTSTEPYQLIEDLNQSPFNVGEVIEMSDFTAEQVAELNRLHGSPFDWRQEQQLMALLNGHPYLTRRALYLVASQRITSNRVFTEAANGNGPFGDHLRYHLFRLNNQEELIQGLRQVIRHHKCQDEKVFFRLRGAGLVRREGNGEFPRCQLYADYFQEYLHV